MGGSISTRLILLITLCAVVVVGTGLAIDYRLTEREILSRLSLEASQTISATVADLENLLDGAEDSAWFVANLLSRQSFSEADLELLAKDTIVINDQVFGSTIALAPEQTDRERGYAPYYFRREGVLRSADLTLGDTPYWQRPWYSEAAEQGRAVWSEPYFDEEGGQVLMTTFSVPVYRLDQSGARRLFAVVTADISLAELDQYLGNLRLGEHGYGFMFSRGGTVLSSPQADNVLRHYTDIIANRQQQEVWSQMLAQATAGRTVSRTIPCPSTTGSCAIRLDALAITGWPVGVVYSEEEMLAPLKEYQSKVVAVTLLTLSIMCLGVWLIVRKITGPLSMLAAASSAFGEGRLDTPLPSSRGNDEVATLVRSFTAMQADLSSYIDNLEEVTASRSRLEGELAAAREIQMAMLPQGGEARDQGERHGLWAQVRPAKSVGGDLYYFHRQDGRLWLAVGDVSDKGVPAALFMARAISLIQQQGDTPPDQAMAVLNDALESGNDSCMFVTLFLAVLDLDSGVLEFASGGHTPPVLLRKGKPTVMAQDDGPALGLAAGLEFPRNRVQLLSGDSLVIYTDGIDEAFNDAAEMCGTVRLLASALCSAALAVDQAGPAIVHAVDSFAGSAPQSDDITLMLLDVSPAAAATSASTQASARFELGPKLSTRAGEWLEHLLEQAGTPPEVIMEMVLVQEELVTNVAKYSGLDTSDEVTVSVRVDSDGLSLEIRDSGAAFDPLSEGERAELGADIDHARVGGLGVHLVTQLTDTQSYRRDNNDNVLTVTRSIATSDRA